MLHSPFEEPVIFPFPVTDPDFSLSFETDRVFTPLPFDRVMVGLAEIGILLPDLEPRKHEWRDSFKPFDVDMESDGPRTTSRFDFARSR
jgi:CCR4-NOT transcription complex subunit 4